MDLNIADQIGKKAAMDETVGKRVRKPAEVPSYTGSMEQIDAMFSSPSQLSERHEAFNAQQSLKNMRKNMETGNIGGGKMPSAIRESVINNPLMMTEGGEDDMQRFTGMLEKSLGGLHKSMGITEQLEQSDKAKNVERIIEDKQRTQTTQAGGVDYELIKMIVEAAVEKKIAEMKPMLTESTQRQQPGLSVMKISDKFLFLDNEDNVYECQMTYKGKNKKRKK